MFGKKEVENSDKILSAFYSKVVNKGEVVSCETCKCLVKKKDACMVLDSNILADLYYCQQHKKPYTRRAWLFDSKIVEYYLGYFKELEVTEDGTPIGYKKIK